MVHVAPKWILYELFSEFCALESSEVVIEAPRVRIHSSLRATDVQWQWFCVKWSGFQWYFSIFAWHLCAVMFLRMNLCRHQHGPQSRSHRRNPEASSQITLWGIRSWMWLMWILWIQVSWVGSVKPPEPSRWESVERISMRHSKHFAEVKSGHSRVSSILNISRRASYSNDLILKRHFFFTFWMRAKAHKKRSLTLD